MNEEGTAGARALGLVHRPHGTPGADRSWARALVVRRAWESGVLLLDVLELDDDAVRNRDILRRLEALAATSAATVLITDGVRLEVAEHLARDLGLRHVPARGHQP